MKTYMKTYITSALSIAVVLGAMAMAPTASACYSGYWSQDGTLMCIYRDRVKVPYGDILNPLFDPRNPHGPKASNYIGPIPLMDLPDLPFNGFMDLRIPRVTIEMPSSEVKPAPALACIGAYCTLTDIGWHLNPDRITPPYEDPIWLDPVVDPAPDVIGPVACRFHTPSNPCRTWPKNRATEIPSSEVIPVVQQALTICIFCKIVRG